MADVYKLAQAMRQQEDEAYQSFEQDDKMTLASDILGSYKSGETDEESLSKIQDISTEFDIAMARLTTNPLTREQEIFDNMKLQGVLEKGRQLANRQINQYPKLTQHIESNFQRWANSTEKQIEDNSKMSKILDRTNTILNEHSYRNRLGEEVMVKGKLDEIEDIFLGLSEGDMALPFISVGKDGKISRNDAFAKIAEITNYVKDNDEFVNEMGQAHPEYQSISNAFQEINAVSQFFASQLVNLNKTSDISLLTEKERMALETYSITGDTAELVAMTADTYAQSSKYEANISTSLSSALDRYIELNQILNTQDDDITKTINNFDASIFEKTTEGGKKAIDALKNISLTIGEGAETTYRSLYDVQKEQDALKMQIKSLDKEYSIYDKQGKSFSQSAEGFQYRDLFESLKIIKDDDKEIPYKTKGKDEVDEGVDEEVDKEVISAKEGTIKAMEEETGLVKDTVKKMFKSITGTPLEKFKEDTKTIKQSKHVINEVMNLSPSQAAPIYPNPKDLDEIIKKYNLSNTHKKELKRLYQYKGNEKKFNKLKSKFMDSVKAPIAEKFMKRIVDRAIGGNLSTRDEKLLDGLSKEMLESFNNTIRHYKKYPNRKHSYLKGLMVKSELIEVIKESL